MVDFKPFEKNTRKSNWIISSAIGVKIKHIWNHHLVLYRDLLSLDPFHCFDLFCNSSVQGSTCHTGPPQPSSDLISLHPCDVWGHVIPFFRNACTTPEDVAKSCKDSEVLSGWLWNFGRHEQQWCWQERITGDTSEQMQSVEKKGENKVLLNSRVKKFFRKQSHWKISARHVNCQQMFSICSNGRFLSCFFSWDSSREIQPTPPFQVHPNNTKRTWGIFVTL